MNLLCPNCQKMLTVPEEFAGQLMKCPLCAGTFTVPGLPGAAPAPAPAPAEQETDTYALRSEPTPLAPPSPFAPPPPAPNPEPPPSPPSLAPLPAEDYRHSAAIWLSPKVLPWIAPACLLLVFFLQFFNWVGVYAGGVPAVTQNAWQAAFGLSSVDGDLVKSYAIFMEEGYKPRVSVLTLFYLLLFFPTLAATVASVALGLIPIKLPPAVEKLLPWRWGIVAAANLILFLFLGLQLLLGFSLDARYGEWVDKQTETKGTKTTQQQKEEAARHGEDMDRLSHTFALRLTVFLHLMAIVCAVLMFWIGQRGPQRPLPRLEWRW